MGLRVEAAIRGACPRGTVVIALIAAVGWGRVVPGAPLRQWTAIGAAGVVPDETRRWSEIEVLGGWKPGSDAEPCVVASDGRLSLLIVQLARIGVHELVRFRGGGSPQCLIE